MSEEKSSEKVEYLKDLLKPHDLESFAEVIDSAPSWMASVRVTMQVVFNDIRLKDKKNPMNGKSIKVVISNKPWDEDD